MGIKMCDHIGRMHAGIGSACTMQNNRFIGNIAEYLLDGLLNTDYARLLSLPTSIIRSTKLNSHRKTLHNDLKT